MEELKDLNPDNTTISQAKKLMREKIDQGVLCPCCNQGVKMYHWRLDAQSAALLIQFHKKNGEWVHPLDDLGTNNGNYAKMRHFGLIESKSKQDKNSRGSGLWRITTKGTNFVLGLDTIAERVRIYNNDAYGFVGNQITIKNALGKKFNYAELMA